MNAVEPQGEKVIHIVASHPSSAKVPIILVAEKEGRRLLRRLSIIEDELGIFARIPNAGRHIAAIGARAAWGGGGAWCAHLATARPVRHSTWNARRSVVRLIRSRSLALRSSARLRLDAAW